MEMIDSMQPREGSMNPGMDVDCGGDTPRCIRSAILYGP
jgi:hypothetical protein